MDRYRSVPARPPQGRARNVLSMLLAFALLLGIMPLITAPTAAAAADEGQSISVKFHFKDQFGETVDFAAFEAPFTVEEDEIVALVDGDGCLDLGSSSSFAVYENYAAFENRQRDITDSCVLDAAAGIVRIPAASLTGLNHLGIVFEASPAHPAYDQLVLAELDTSPVELALGEETTLLESDIPHLLQGQSIPSNAATFSATFPGESGKHYALNPYTRMENFAENQQQKQAAYGFPSAMIGTYGFGVLFGASQHHENGVAGRTEYGDNVLNPNASSYDPVVDAFLGETIAARCGADAPFATAQTDGTYFDRYLTTGNSFSDAASSGTAPRNRAMAHGTCGSAGVNNGYGAIASNPYGDNYIAYKGIYTGSQAQYRGWYKLFFKIDARSAATHQDFQDVVGYLLVAPVNKGSAQVSKVSANPTISNANGNYALDNAVFAAFADKAQAQQATTLASQGAWKDGNAARSWADANAAFAFTTGSDGTSAVVEDIEAGDYYLCELFAPRGFRLSSEIKSITVEASSSGEVSAFEFADEPQRGSIDLLKRSNNDNLTAGNPCYTLAGAVFGIYADAACTKLFAEIRTELDKNAQGYARLDEVPIGSYWVREIKRPLEGYAIDNTAYPVKVVDRGVSRVNTEFVTDKAKLNPLDLLLQKKDAQSQQSHAQGAATLGDAHFRIDYYAVKEGSADQLQALTPKASWVVRTDDDGAFYLDKADETFPHVKKDGTIEELAYKVSGPGFYQLSDGRAALPIGTYVIQEVKAPEGYLLDDTVHIRHVSDEDHDEEALGTFEAEQDGDLVTDRVARSDLRFVKRADGAAKLAGIPFKITSKTTGEWHILVTDKNGLASTQSTTGHPHDVRTNANDEQFRGPEGEFQMPLAVDGGLLDATAGLWFGLDSTGTSVPIDNALGALPYDTYEIEELRCPGNQLFRLIVDEVVVDESDEGSSIDLGTLNNVSLAEPAIGTTAVDAATGTHEGVPAEEVTIIDTVVYQGLTPGNEYKLSAVLMDRVEQTPWLVDGEIVMVEKTFVAEDSAGTVDVEITLPGHNLDGVSLVVFESLTYQDVELAIHADINDEGQTVSYAYPDLPLPPTGGPEETTAVTQRLAQTGDEGLTLVCLAALVAVVGGGLIVLSSRKRQ